MYRRRDRWDSRGPDGWTDLALDDATGGRRAQAKNGPKRWLHNTVNMQDGTTGRQGTSDKHGGCRSRPAAVKLRRCNVGEVAEWLKAAVC